jgi:hypothetical protein
MATDKTIPAGQPGVAGFETESYGNLGDIRYGDGDLTTPNITITATGADVDLGLYSVVNVAGLLAVHNAVRDAGCANYVLAEPVFIEDGSTMVVPVYRTGNLNMDAMVWGGSYDDDVKKAAAFEGSLSPTLFVGKPKYNSNQIY